MCGVSSSSSTSSSSSCLPSPSSTPRDNSLYYYHYYLRLATCMHRLQKEPPSDIHARNFAMSQRESSREGSAATATATSSSSASSLTLTSRLDIEFLLNPTTTDMSCSSGCRFPWDDGIAPSSKQWQQRQNANHHHHHYRNNNVPDECHQLPASAGSQQMKRRLDFESIGNVLEIDCHRHRPKTSGNNKKRRRCIIKEEDMWKLFVVHQTITVQKDKPKTVPIKKAAARKKSYVFHNVRVGGGGKICNEDFRMPT